MMTSTYAHYSSQPAGVYNQRNCSACGQRIWAARSDAVSPDEPAQCGRCRMNMVPVHPRFGRGSRPTTTQKPKEDEEGLGGLRSCPVCLEELPASERFEYAVVENESWENRSSRCDGHGLCKPCVGQYVQTQILEGGRWNLRCPGDGNQKCRHLLVEADLRSALDDSDTRERVLTTHAQLRRNGTEERFADLLKAVVAAKKKRNNKDGPPMTGGDDDYAAVPTAAGTDDGAAASEAWIAQECQVCPGCLVVVRRETGCQTVVCRCGQEFCFRCGGAYDEEDEEEDEEGGCLCDDLSRLNEDEGDGDSEDDEDSAPPALGFWLATCRAGQGKKGLPEALREGLEALWSTARARRREEATSSAAGEPEGVADQQGERVQQARQEDDQDELQEASGLLHREVPTTTEEEEAMLAEAIRRSRLDRRVGQGRPRMMAATEEAEEAVMLAEAIGRSTEQMAAEEEPAQEEVEAEQEQIETPESEDDHEAAESEASEATVAEEAEMLGEAIRLCAEQTAAEEKQAEQKVVAEQEQVEVESEDDEATELFQRERRRWLAANAAEQRQALRAAAAAADLEAPNPPLLEYLEMLEPDAADDEEESSAETEPDEEQAAESPMTE